MNKDNLLQITNELYRLTLLFPKREPLRYKMREIGDEILAKRLTSDVKQDKNYGDPISIDSLLEVLNGFFEVVKNQNWIKPEDLLNLQKEYSNLKEQLKQEEKKTEAGPLPAPVLGEEKAGFAERQKKILEILKEKGRAQVWEIKKIFPQVSKRTIRRDFENLFKRGIIERMGERNETYYTQAR